MKHAPTLAAWLVLLVSGCLGTETGNPPFSASAGFSGHAPMGIVVEPTIDDAWWSVGSLAFVAEGECGDGTPEPQLEGPLAARLTGASGDASEITLGEGDYCGARLALIAAASPLPAGAPARLEGATLVIDATAADGTPVQVTTDAAATFSMTGDAPFRLAPDEPPVIVGVDWSLLFAGVSLLGAETTDGAIRIDADHNADRLSVLEANLPGAVALYRDTNGDGVLDLDEARQPPLARP